MPQYFKISSICNNDVISKDYVEDLVREGRYEAHVAEEGQHFTRDIPFSKNKLSNINMVNSGDICFTRVKSDKKHSDIDPIWKLTVDRRSEPQIVQSLPENSTKIRNQIIKPNKDEFTAIVFLYGNWEYVGIFKELTDESKALLEPENYGRPKYFPRTVIRLSSIIIKQPEQTSIKKIEALKEIKICVELTFDIKQLLDSVKLINIELK